jgi:hypothetical protein
MNESELPLRAFKKKLVAFATGTRRGIRNPFVIVPVAPEAEQLTAQHLANWTPGSSTVSVTPIYLDRLMPQTDVFQTVSGLSPSFFGNGQDQSEEERKRSRAESEENTLRDNLPVEMVQVLVQNHKEACATGKHILLLLHLGALFPFARASELLDEMDRRGVYATIGVPFPGRIIAGKLSFFGERAQHYYPAHRIEGQITSSHLQHI